MSNPYSLDNKKYSWHSIIAREIWKNMTVLDIGCNSGYLWTIADPTCNFYGLEYMDEAIIESKKIYTDVVKYNLEELIELPWKEKFDIIIFADVLEHIRYPQETLMFMDRYLNPNGKIIVSLPNVANWQLRFWLMFWNFNATETGIMDKTHFHYYTFKKAVKLLNDSGYKVNKKYGGASIFGIFIHYLPFLRWLLATNVIVVASRI